MSGDDNARWAALISGYRLPYDPRSALAALEAGDHERAFAELWNELHHQGDVDTASYAAVPELVRIYKSRAVPDWNVHALVGTIELRRGRGKNPELPSWLANAYHDALHLLLGLALDDLRKSDDPFVTRCALAIVALMKGLRDYAIVLLDLDESDLAEIVKDR